MLQINEHLSIPDWCYSFTAMRAGGPGGQHVNKNATAVQLRLHIASLPLSDYIKNRVSRLRDHHITQDGWIIISASNSRSQEANRADALERLKAIFLKALERKKHRRPTKPTRGSVERRLQSKKKRSDVKAKRRDVPGQRDD